MGLPVKRPLLVMSRLTRSNQESPGILNPSGPPGGTLRHGVFVNLAIAIVINSIDRVFVNAAIPIIIQTRVGWACNNTGIACRWIISHQPDRLVDTGLRQLPLSITLSIMSSAKIEPACAVNPCDPAAQIVMFIRDVVGFGIARLTRVNSQTIRDIFKLIPPLHISGCPAIHWICPISPAG